MILSMFREKIKLQVTFPEKVLYTGSDFAIETMFKKNSIQSKVLITNLNRNDHLHYIHRPFEIWVHQNVY